MDAPSKAHIATQEWYAEFYRRAQAILVKLEGSLPDPAAIKEHGKIDVDADGTRRFFWRGEEKFHMRIDTNWREDGM